MPNLDKRNAESGDPSKPKSPDPLAPATEVVKDLGPAKDGTVKGGSATAGAGGGKIKRGG